MEEEEGEEGAYIGFGVEATADGNVLKTMLALSRPGPLLSPSAESLWVDHSSESGRENVIRGPSKAKLETADRSITAQSSHLPCLPPFLSTGELARALSSTGDVVKHHYGGGGAEAILSAATDTDSQSWRDAAHYARTRNEA